MAKFITPEGKEHIDEYRAKQGLNLKDLASRMKLKESKNLTNFINGKKSFGLKTAVKLAAAIGMEYADFKKYIREE